MCNTQRLRYAPTMTFASPGFTLIELMVTITVMSVLLMIAVPSFSDAVLGMKLNSHANNLVASVHTARSEAIKRNAAITLCASVDGATCAASGGWEQGWIVMCNTSDNVTCNASGADTIVIKHQSAAPSGFLVTGLLTGTATVTRSITFQPTAAGITPATLTICRATPSAGHTERVVTISVSGRPAVKKTMLRACP